MELQPLLFMSSCFLTLSGLTFGDQSEKHVTVKEGDDAILPCSLGTNENSVHVRFEWTKEGTEEKVYIHDTGMNLSPALPGRVLHFPDDLQHGNASIKIDNVQPEDGGIYTCNFPSRGKTFRIELVVGAAELYITILDQRNGWVLLQCDVESGHPEPTVEWWDSNDQIIPSEEPEVSKQGGRFYIALKATVKKNGRYRCVATQEEIKHQAQKEINVDLNEGPVFVKEGDDAILPCSLGTNENSVHVRFEWTKEGTEEKVYIRDTGVDYSPALPGRVSHFRDDLKNGNASIKINKVQLKDGGIYTCNFPSSGKTFRIELVVGAAELYVTSHDQRNGGALLQCDVQSGLPKPTVEWWDSNDQIIPSEEPQVSEQGGRFNITLKATVKKSGRYRCVATQEEINQQAQKEINVDFDEKSDSAQGLPVWAAILIGGFIVVVIVVAVGVVLKVKGYSLKKGSQRRENGCSTEMQKNLTSERS